MRLRPLTATLVAAALATAPVALAGGADDPLPVLQQERTITQTIKPSFHTVKITLDAGAITLRPSGSHVLKLHETYIRDEPVVTSGVKDGTLTITVHCARDLQTPVFFAQLLPCTTDLTLGVPSRLTVIASTGGGNVDITSVHGDLTVDSGGGDVTLAHVRSNKLDASTSSGALSVSDAIATSAVLQSGGGTVQLTTAKIPTVSASTSSGDVALRGVASRTITATSGGGDVLVAASTAATIRASSSSGAVDVTGSTATRSLDLTSGGGDVHLTGAVAPKVKASTSTGDVISTDGRLDDLTLTSGGGDITVSGTETSSLDASTSSGDITTKLIEPARALTASTGGGTVRLTVPKGAYAVSTSNGGGTTQLDGITIDKTAPRTISASTSSGDIFITGV